jgi:hypothetical protein
VSLVRGERSSDGALRDVAAIGTGHSRKNAGTTRPLTTALGPEGKPIDLIDGKRLADALMAIGR